MLTIQTSLKIFVIFVCLCLNYGLLTSYSRLHRRTKYAYCHNAPGETNIAPKSSRDGSFRIVSILNRAILTSYFASSMLPSSANGSNVKKTFNDHDYVTKSSIDDRDYRAITLPNALRVLLISDSSSSRAACSLAVHAGSLLDPVNAPGLAHFNEHMLFLGTKKYPVESEYAEYLASHGGSSNAYTDNEDTVYYFDINVDHLDEGLERFSDFFVAPLFTQSATERELNAIDSEHSKNINNDGFRLYQLEKDSANYFHPLHKFATGNKKTLLTDTIAQNIDIRQQLLEFYNKYYSSNIMTLCIVGSQSLDELEKMTKKYFTAIKNKDIQNPYLDWWGKIKPYNSQNSASLLEIVPIGETKKLILSWPIWIKSQEEKYLLLKAKPELIISHLLGHEGVGSIRSLLIKNGWCNGISAAPSIEISDCQTFEVTVDLTDLGFKHRNEIISIIFGYIDLLKNVPIPPYVFREVSLLSQLSFNFSEKAEPAQTVSTIASEMQIYNNPSDYLIGSYLFVPSDSAITNYLNELNAENVRIKVVSKDFEGKTTSIGRFYNTEYNNITDLNSETKAWEKISFSSYKTLRYPNPNYLLPENFDIISKSTYINAASKLTALNEAPDILRDDDKWRVWYKLDSVFKQPKAYIIVLLSVDKVKFTPDYIVNSKLFSACFTDSINEYLYEARLAGLSFDIDFTSKGIQLIFSGFNDKIFVFIDEIIKSLARFRPNSATYNRYRELIKRNLYNWKVQQPYSHCSYFSTLALETLQFPIETLIDKMDSSTISDIDLFLENTIRSSYGTVLATGNLKRDTISTLISIMENYIPFKPLPLEDRSNRRTIKVKDISTLNSSGLIIRETEPNENDDNSAATFYFQLPSYKIEDYVYVELLAEAVEQVFYNSLRTKQQLGYIVYSGLKFREGIYSLAFVVQSSILHGDELVKKIEDFISLEALPSLRGMSKEMFNSYCNGIIVRKAEPDARLTSQANRFWSEILFATNLNTTPNFDRHQDEINAIKNLKMKDFISFCENFLIGKNRRLLISSVKSKKVAKNIIMESKYTPISDYIAFRDSSEEM